MPIPAYSGNSSAEEWKMAEDAGFDHWITKPASRQKIIDEILKWMKTKKKSK